MNPAKPILLVPLAAGRVSSKLSCLVPILAGALGCSPTILCITRSARPLPVFGTPPDSSGWPADAEFVSVARKGSKAGTILEWAQKTGARTILLSFNYDHWLQRWIEGRTVKRVLGAFPCPVWVYRASRFPENERVELYPCGKKGAPFVLSFAPQLLSLPNDRRVLTGMVEELLCQPHERT